MSNASPDDKKSYSNYGDEFSPPPPGTVINDEPEPDQPFGHSHPALTHFLEFILVIAHGVSAIIMLGVFVVMTIIKIPLHILGQVFSVLSFFAIMTLSRMLGGVFVFGAIFGAGYYMTQNAENYDGAIGSLAQGIAGVVKKDPEKVMPFAGGFMKGSVEKASKAAKDQMVSVERAVFGTAIEAYPKPVQGFVEVAIKYPELYRELKKYDVAQMGEKGEVLVPLMSNMLYSEDIILRDAAYNSLSEMNTPEARKAIYQYLQYVRNQQPE